MKKYLVLSLSLILSLQAKEITLDQPLCSPLHIMHYRVDKVDQNCRVLAEVVGSQVRVTTFGFSLSSAWEKASEARREFEKLAANDVRQVAINGANAFALFLANHLQDCGYMVTVYGKPTLEGSYELLEHGKDPIDVYDFQRKAPGEDVEVYFDRYVAHRASKYRGHLVHMPTYLQDLYARANKVGVHFTEDEVGNDYKALFVCAESDEEGKLRYEISFPKNADEYYVLKGRTSVQHKDFEMIFTKDGMLLRGDFELEPEKSAERLRYLQEISLEVQHFFYETDQFMPSE